MIVIIEKGKEEKKYYLIKRMNVEERVNIRKTELK